MRLTRNLILGITASAIAATAAFAASMHEDREKMMKDMAGKAGVLFGMAQGKAPYDAAAATAAATELLALAKTDYQPLFPEGDTEGEGNRALPAIWEQPDEFKADHEALIAAAEGVAAVAGNGLDALKGAVGPLGGACGDCHKTFRKPE